MKVLLDLNVLLDVLLVRHPWFADSSQVWDAHRNGLITAGLAAFSIPTVFYIVRRHTDTVRAKNAVEICLTVFEIVPVGRLTLEAARALPGTDFEDNLQLACAMDFIADALITRDPSGYSGASIPILAPAVLISKLAPGTP